MDREITEITSYCGDTYQKVKLAHGTFYHRIKRESDIAFTPVANNLSLAILEVDLLRVQLTTALAEGDWLLERLNHKSCQIGALKQVVAEREAERDQLKRERDTALLRVDVASEQVEHWLDDGGCADCGVANQAYLQGAEAMRETAADFFWDWGFGVDIGDMRLRFHDELRALQVPERGK